MKRYKDISVINDDDLMEDDRGNDDNDNNNDNEEDIDENHEIIPRVSAQVNENNQNPFAAGGGGVGGSTKRKATNENQRKVMGNLNSNCNLTAENLYRIEIQHANKHIEI